MRTALLLGASGLVGGELLNLLATDPAYERVVAFVRRPLVAPPNKAEPVVIDYDQPGTYRSHLAVDDVFCCLGTTIKQAGSQAAFRRVDLEIPLTIARESLAAGAKRYLVVTAVGASAQSSVFYSRIKGELEHELSLLPFPGGVKIFRPSLLLGARNETRRGEKAAAVLMSALRPLLLGKLQRYRAISGGAVARAMLQAAKTADTNPQVFEGAKLFALARA